VGLTTLPCKRENVEKPPRNSVGFCGGGQGLSWAVEPRKEEEEEEEISRVKAIKYFNTVPRLRHRKSISHETSPYSATISDREY
jgi:hypothetical protein